MKTRQFFYVFSLLLFSFGFTQSEISDQEKKEALADYTICKQIADQWLFKLDSSNYSYLFSIKFPEEIKVENLKELTQSAINHAQTVYGRVNSREFIGAHIWSGKKLLTYYPGVDEQFFKHMNIKRADDGFYIIDPKYMGLSSADQMFASFPKGKYIILMYKSYPTNKSYAEEAVVLWNNPIGKWQVFTYKIADDI
jgi:hypothetical protein